MYLPAVATTGVNKEQNNMAKNASKPVVKKTAPVITPEASVPKTRNRQAVLVKLTASKLHDLIGDQPIGVSRKELTALITKASTADVLAAAGL